MEANPGPRAPRRRPTSRAARGGGLPWLAAALLVAIVLVAAAWARGDRLLPGTYVAGVDLGGRPTADAARRLAAAWAERTVTLTAGPDQVRASPPALGLILDAPATVAAAHAAGRAPGAVWNTLIRRQALVVPPVWRFDGAVAGATLAALAPEVERAPISAGIQVRDGQVASTSAVDGRALDQAATLVALQGQADRVVAGGQLALVTRPVPAPVQDVSQALAAARSLLAQPLPLAAWDPVRNEDLRWELAPEQWGPWLQLASLSPDGRRPEWALDSAAVAAWLGGQGERLGADRFLEPAEVVAGLTGTLNGQAPARRLRVYHRETRHEVAAGETLASIGENYGIPYPWIQQANPGLGDQLRVGQEIRIPSPDLLLPLPIVEGKRIVVSLAEQEMVAYENGQEKWRWPVSTGIDSSPTAPGVFQVQSHHEDAYASNWDLNMPRFMGIYRPIPSASFMNGFHGFPKRGGTQILWTNSLGHRVTYGCILLGSEPSRLLYDWAEEGTVVEVRP